MERIPFDVDTYVQEAQSRNCFICAIVAGEHDSELEQVIAEDDDNIAFLARYPTLRATVLVAPKVHREHVLRDLTEDAYLRSWPWCIGLGERWSRSYQPNAPICLAWAASKATPTSIGTSRPSHRACHTATSSSMH